MQNINIAKLYRYRAVHQVVLPCAAIAVDQCIKPVYWIKLCQVLCWFVRSLLRCELCEHFLIIRCMRLSRTSEWWNCGWSRSHWRLTWPSVLSLYAACAAIASRFEPTDDVVLLRSAFGEELRRISWANLLLMLCHCGHNLSESFIVVNNRSIVGEALCIWLMLVFCKYVLCSTTSTSICYL